MTRSARSQKRDAIRAAGLTRERELPPRASALITAKIAEANRLRAEAQELIEAALEGMGLDITPREDGLVWNVTDGEGGKLVAKFGPRLSSTPNKASVLAAVKEMFPAMTTIEPEVEKVATA